MRKLEDYVIADSDGAMYVGEARVPMEAIMVAFEGGDSPEGIRSRYPALTLEEVYGAITYYLANPGPVDDYLKRQDALWKEWEAKLNANPAPVVLRLRALRTERAKAK